MYEDEPLGSIRGNRHLLELVAVAIHDLAGRFFAEFHPDGEPAPEDPDFQAPAWGRKKKISLSIRPFDKSTDYPGGFADTVGYWAEQQIFGGVVVFDRGPHEGSRQVRADAT